MNKAAKGSPRKSAAKAVEVKRAPAKKPAAARAAKPGTAAKRKLPAAEARAAGRKAVLSAAARQPAGHGLPHQLERAVPYLLVRAGERMGNSFSRELRPFKLTLNEWRTCVALHLEPHQRLSEIAAHTSADLSTISRVIDGLIRRGLAQRDRAAEDARAIAVSLTPEGALLTEKIIPIAQLYERIALSGMSAEEAETLRGLLRRVYDNIGVLAR